MSLRSRIDAIAAGIQSPADATALLDVAAEHTQRAYQLSANVGYLGGTYDAARALCDQARDYIERCRARVASEPGGLTPVAQRMSGLALVQAADAVDAVGEAANQPGLLEEFLDALASASGSIAGAVVGSALALWPLVALAAVVFFLMRRTRT